jgi:hypothetical protein
VRINEIKALPLNPLSLTGEGLSTYFIPGNNVYQHPLNFNSSKLKKHLLIFSVLFLFCGGMLMSQTDTVINGKRYKIVEDTATPGTKKKRSRPPVDSVFVKDGKKLKYYNNWLTGGAGIQQNLTYNRKYGFAGGVDYHFHIKHHYFQLGTVITGEKFGSYDNYNFHLGYGKRLEDKDFHAAAFLGVSYSTGYAKVDSSGRYERPFKEPGVYIEGQVIKKITYDVGIGISVFGNYCQEQSIIGGRVIIYFSGAYKGKK